MAVLKYTLMQKIYPVANIMVNPVSGYITDVGAIFSPERLPVPALFEKNTAEALREWLEYRSIPKSRKGISDLLQEEGLASTCALAFRSMGLSLSDQYWFLPERENLSWKDVNLFRNGFESRAVGRFRLHSPSPDTSSNGELTKWWEIRNDKRLLFKETSGPFFQQNANEVIASRLLDAAGIPHVKYVREKDGGKEYAVCETFCDEYTEFVPAYHFLRAEKKSNSESPYHHFLRCLEKAGLSGYRKNLEEMSVFDILIDNTDRHFFNFGFIRDPDMLEYKGFAPLFDHGNSLWYNDQTAAVSGVKHAVKPFWNSIEKALSDIQPDMTPFLNLTDDLIRSVIKEELASVPYMEKSRMKRIRKGAVKRFRLLLDTF